MNATVIKDVAERYKVSTDVVESLLDSLRRTGGTMAQFDHPELGGPGQWLPGMVMVGDMMNNQLKAHVAGLCSELSAIVRGTDSAGFHTLSRPPGTAAASGEAHLPAGESWWPATYGHPSASGGQNGIRYAVFPEKRRLLIQRGARIDCYDTGIYHVSGVGQQQGHASTLTFTSRAGEVPLEELKKAEL
jgi:hypothetical protein